MKFTLKRNFVIMFVLLILLFLNIGMISASEDVNSTLAIDDGVEVPEVSFDEDLSSDSQISDELNETSNIEASEIINTNIKSNQPSLYYKENGDLVTYLTDDNNNPIPNKQLNIVINGINYTRTTDNTGKAVLNLNLKPNTYDVTINFDGDLNYSASNFNTSVKVFKAPLSIKTSNFNTYLKSDLFFKAKVLNTANNKPVSGIKVLFEIYSGKSLYKKYYAVSDKNGVATLNKNLKVGKYTVYTSIQDEKQKSFITVKKSKNKATMIVNPTAEVGCCSVYVQVSGTEAVAGFRRDSTYAADIHIVAGKWYGRTAVKQYKTDGGYSFHLIVTADGWMIGTGGADGASVNRAIERIAGEMVQSNSISSSKLEAIRSYIASLGLSIGHFAIKAPDGRYGVVWVDDYDTGKLKPGQYICVPNSESYFRKGTYNSFSVNPAKAGIKILATDYYGVNRRDAFVYHWRATTVDGSTSSLVAAYGANDNGKYVGRSTGYLKDNVYFKDVFYSKDSLPIPPSKKLLGVHQFGKIDKHKIQTAVNAPAVTSKYHVANVFKISVMNSFANKPVVATIKVKVFTGDTFRIYTLKTDKNGVAKLNIGRFLKGTHKVVIYSGNTNYFISKATKIVIKG